MVNKDVAVHFPIEKDKDDSIRKKRIEHEIKTEDKRFETEYSTCCSRSGKTDKRLLDYASKMTIGLLSLSFCCVQIARAGECDPLIPFYSSVITLIIGSFIGEKSHKKKVVD